VGEIIWTEDTKLLTTAGTLMTTHSRGEYMAATELENECDRTLQRSIGYAKRPIADSKCSVGTLNEKTLHSALKHYFEPDTTNHEIMIGSNIADIVTEKGIIEIQTQSFEKLRSKLTEFLEISPVTVIYPLPRIKWLLWIDNKTGAVSKKRKSPKQGKIVDAIPELYKIKPFLTHRNFYLCIALVDMEEYRYLNGWSEDKKRGSTRCNRIPVEVVETTIFKSADDYQQFIPDDLPYRFTSRDYKEAVNRSIQISQTALNVLHHIGAVNRVGKQGNHFIYERSGNTK